MSLLRLLKYSILNISFTPFNNFSKHYTTMFQSILTYSLALSLGNLYVNIQIAIVHFCNGERLTLQIEETHAFAFVTLPEIESLSIQDFHKSNHLTIDDVLLHNCDLSYCSCSFAPNGVVLLLHLNLVCNLLKLQLASSDQKTMSMP